MANEKRLIDANALLERLASSSESWAKNIQAIRNWWPHAVGIKDNIVAVIKEAPTVDAVEVVHGRWVEKIKDERFGDEWDEIALYECSVCKSEFVEGMGAWRYCPNCGAKMDG